MAQIADNQVDADMFSNLQQDSEIQTVTKVVQPDKAFIQKCLHPPSSVPGFIGIPTNDARSQVVLEWRNLFMQKPSYGFLQPPTVVVKLPVQPIEFAFLIPTGPSKLGFCFYADDTGTNWFQDYNNVDDNDLYDFWKFADDAQLYRPVYKSLTTYLNATAFNDTGFVTTNQFAPPILFSGSLLSYSTQRPLEFLSFIKSYARYNSLVVQKDNLKYDEFPRYVRDMIHSKLLIGASDARLNIDPNVTIQVVNLGGVGLTDGNGISVPSMSQVLQQSQRSYGGKALEGTFGVQRLNTIAPSWQIAGNTYRGSPHQNGLYQCWIHTISADGSIHFVPLTANVPLGTTPLQLGPFTAYDALWSSDMTWQWIHYSGLSFSNQQDPRTASQILIRKYYTGFEVQPAPLSAWSGLVKAGPKPSLMHMQALMDQFFNLKDGMPARFNFLGALASIASPYLKGALNGALKGAFSSADSPVAKTQVKEKVAKKEIKEDKKVVKADNTLLKKIQKLERELASMRSSNRSSNDTSRFSSRATSGYSTPRNRSPTQRTLEQAASQLRGPPQRLLTQGAPGTGRLKALGVGRFNV
jgi:hypothetical protein